jgi:hypothetical protein
MIDSSDANCERQKESYAMSMLPRSPRITALAVIVVAAVGVAAAPSSQGGSSKSDQSSPDELLSEVRGLRADLQQMATISVRAQLLVGRLQLQEQRINVLAAQVNDVRRLIDIKQSGQVPLTLELKRSEEASRSGSVGSEEQKHLEDVVPRLKAQLGQMQKEEQQLHLQETELSNQLATEQGRWIDFNSRLDELERQLPQSHR